MGCAVLCVYYCGVGSVWVGVLSCLVRVEYVCSVCASSVVWAVWGCVQSVLVFWCGVLCFVFCVWVVFSLLLSFCMVLCVLCVLMGWDRWVSFVFGPGSVVAILSMSEHPNSRMGVLRGGVVAVVDDDVVIEGPILTMDMLEISCLTLWYERDAFRELFPAEVMEWLENEFQLIHDALRDLEDWRMRMESLSVSSVLPRGLRLNYFDP